MKTAAIGTFVLVIALAGDGIARDYQVFDVVGDSISFGVNADNLMVQYGWVDMLFGEAGLGHPAESNTLAALWPAITAYNSAVPGSKASDWAQPGSAYLRNVTNHRPDLVVVFIGGNDGIAYASDGVFSAAEQAQYLTNLALIVDELRSASPRPEIVMVNYYDLFDGQSAQLPVPQANYRAISQATIEGNRIIEEVASAKGCFFVSIYETFMHHAYGVELGDTGHQLPDYVRTPLASFDIHPVTSGHGRIYELIRAALAELKDIPKFTGISSEVGTCVLRWSSGIGQTCVVEWTADLMQPFTPVVTNLATPPGNVYTDSVPLTGSAFYRIRVR